LERYGPIKGKEKKKEEKKEDVNWGEDDSDDNEFDTGVGDNPFTYVEKESNLNIPEKYESKICKYF
jgi:hypothetical protein